MTPIEIVKKAVPDASDDEANYIIWNRTAFPVRVSAREIYAAARRHVRAAANKISLCDHCEERADFDKFECRKCHEARMRAWGN